MGAVANSVHDMNRQYNEAEDRIGAAAEPGLVHLREQQARDEAERARVAAEEAQQEERKRSLSAKR